MTGSQLAESPAPAAPSPPPATSALVGRPALAFGAVVLIGLFGIVARVIVAHQSLFADELSTYWIVATHDFGGVMSLMYGTYHNIPHAEITPPLFFMLSWLTSQLGHAPELVRLPSLVAGALTLPVVYLLGLRTVRRPAALAATVLVALSPFMIYYSAEARSYAVMMLLATASTLGMLLAVDTGRARWWVLYAVSACGAFYSHYTCAFYLAAQLFWVLWAHPEARRRAVIATVAAAAGVLPWISGLINDYNSPTTKILSDLSPFTFHYVTQSAEHWAIGFPYVEGGGLRALPGMPALILMALAAAAAAAGIWSKVLSLGVKNWASKFFDRRVLLVFLLALSVPVGEALASAVSSHIFGVRNLAASWPPLALAAASLMVGAGPRWRTAAVGLAVVGFGLAAAKMLTQRWSRPDFQAAGSFIDSHASRGDVVIDATGVLSPGPLTGLDLVLHKPHGVIRAQAPQERDHPYTVFDPFTTARGAATRAARLAQGRRLFVVAYDSTALVVPAPRLIPAPYRLVETRHYRDFIGLTLQVWATSG